MGNNEKNGKKWKYKAIIITAVMLSFIALIMIQIGTAPKPKIEFVAGREVLFEGDSGGSIIDSMVVKIVPDGERIDVLNISGELYFYEFSYKTLTYEKIKLENDWLDYMSLSIGMNGTLGQTFIGNFSNGYVKVNIFNCHLFPITSTTGLKLYFKYSFPAESCSCRNKHYMYLFRPTFRQGYIN